MILQRYFATSIAQSVSFVLAAFLGLQAFMDLTAELPSVGKGSYTIGHAFLYVLILLPGHVYELMPVAALIGTIYTMAQFAQTSEFTIMRASGLSTVEAAKMLVKIGTGFVLITFIFGELITPRTATLAEQMRLSAKGATVSQQFRTGMWTKDIVRAQGNTGTVTGSRFFNVKKISADGALLEVKLYEFDTAFRLRLLTTAASAHYLGDNMWRLSDVTETYFSNSGKGAANGVNGIAHESSIVDTRKLPSKDLMSEITPKIISVSASSPDTMSAQELAVYTRHLAENRQETDRFQIAFWKKIIDPFTIFVLMALGLPFAYLHTRSGGVSLKIFIGIMIGVTFFWVNALFSHLGLLSTWPAFVTAVAPSVLFLGLALAALWWVERH